MLRKAAIQRGIRFAVDMSDLTVAESTFLWEPSGGATKLLLVDDDEHNLLALEAALEGIADELVSVRSGEDALRELLSRDFAAILLDVKMPGMDGFETAELIRSRQRCRGIPILFLTAYRSEAHLFRGYDLGAVDFLFKPIVPEILRSKVSAFVELARSADLLRQQAATLARAEERFRMLLEAAPDAMLIAREDGTIILVNSRTEELFLSSRKNLLGKNLKELVPEWTRAGQATGIEMRAVSGAFREFPAEVTSSPLRTDDGVLVIVVIRDVTERRMIEDKIRQLNFDLEQRVTARTAELVRSNGALREFAWAASHDLQEPLRGIVVHSQLLERSSDSLQDEQKELLKHIIEGGRRMDGLLRSLRQYMQVADTKDHQLLSTTATDCIALAIEHLQPLISSSGATIEIGNLPKVVAVPVLLTQVFQNLLANALKYRGGSAPLIQVSADRHGDRWIFSVKDNGIGVDPRYHERIFGVFKRLNHSMEGTGIGLAICKSAVEHWGGRIWIESQLGRGSTFYFSARAADE